MIESIDHINIVVRDLEAMVAFYRDALGLSVSKRVRISGKWIDDTVGLGGVMADVVYLDLAKGPRVELIRYIAPDGKPADGFDRPNTPGLRHMAFRVQDIEGLSARLRGAGVRFFSGIQSVPDSQVTYAGGVRKRLVYFQDPEGNLLELCEYR